VASRGTELLKHPPQPEGGRPFRSDRDCFAGIVYRLRNGIRWNALPKCMSMASALRVPRTLTDAQAAALLRRVRSRAFRRRLQYLLQPHLPQRPVPVTAAIQPLD
jgi:transposase